MKKLLIPALLALVVFTGCSSANTVIFGKKTPLEKYADKLEDDGLHTTAEGRQWLAASEKAVQSPVTIGLPYRQAGRFSFSKPQAVGLRFSAKQGERLTFHVTKPDTANFVLYAELYKVDGAGSPKRIEAVDTNAAAFTTDVAENGEYILTLQPQLFRVGDYSLSISTGPSLFFPVADKKAYIGSVWGDDRDAGKRSHEGVDIFAPKRTPAVAAADGFITGVRESGIGGKTVWLRPEGQNITLYYAHLDEQLVQEGQPVKKGDTIGLVGNTGNARFTPSHLHFGVYGFGGAINPFPYVNRTVKEAAALPKKKMADALRLVKDLLHEGALVKKNTLLLPMAITTNGYLAQLPDDRLVLAPFSVLEEAKQPLKKAKATIAATLTIQPGSNATGLTSVAAGATVSVLGYFNEFAFVRLQDKEGWLPLAALNG